MVRSWRSYKVLRPEAALAIEQAVAQSRIEESGSAHNS